MPTVTLVLIYAPGELPPNARQVADALRKQTPDVAIPADDWPLAGQHGGVHFRLAPTDAPDLAEHHLARALLDEEGQERVRQADHALAVSLDLGEGIPMEQVQAGLRLLLPLFERPLAVLDAEASSLHPAAWARAVATSPVPPRPDSLVSLHTVNDGDAPRWMHSHGLARFGLHEVEVLEVDEEHTYDLSHILGAVAASLMIEGEPEPGEIVTWASGVDAALVPWTEVVASIDPGLGGPADRDEAHPEDSLVLVIPGDGQWRSAAELGPSLPESVVIFRTTWETDRMEALARLRWEIFRQLHHVLRGDGHFMFLAKFCYEGPGDQGYREHLWFRVLSADARSATAELLNEPHQDLGMHEGDEVHADIDRLSDIQVMSRIGTFDAETLPQLLEILAGVKR